MSAYTRQKVKSKYRNCIRLERASQKQSSDTHKTVYDRVKRCRERKIDIKASERVNVDAFARNKRPYPQHSHTQFFFFASKQGSDDGDPGARNRCAITVLLNTLNWRAVFRAYFVLHIGDLKPAALLTSQRVCNECLAALSQGQHGLKQADANWSRCPTRGIAALRDATRRNGKGRKWECPMENPMPCQRPPHSQRRNALHKSIPFRRVTLIELDAVSCTCNFLRISFTNKVSEVDVLPVLTLPKLPLSQFHVRCVTYARLHHRGPKLDPRSDLRSTQKTVAPFEFRTGLEIEMKFISNRRYWRFQNSIRDHQPSFTSGSVLKSERHPIGAGLDRSGNRSDKLAFGPIDSRSSRDHFSHTEPGAPSPSPTIICCSSQLHRDDSSVVGKPMRVIEVSTEQRQNERAGETGDPSPTNGIVRHDSHMRKSGATRPGIELGQPWWKASRLTAQPPWPLVVKTPLPPPLNPHPAILSGDRGADGERRPVTPASLAAVDIHGIPRREADSHELIVPGRGEGEVGLRLRRGAAESAPAAARNNMKVLEVAAIDLEAGVQTTPKVVNGTGEDMLRDGIDSCDTCNRCVWRIFIPEQMADHRTVMLILPWTKDEVDRSRWLRTTNLRVPTLNCSPAYTSSKNGVTARPSSKPTGFDSRWGHPDPVRGNVADVANRPEGFLGVLRRCSLTTRSRRVLAVTVACKVSCFARSFFGPGVIVAPWGWSSEKDTVGTQRKQKYGHSEKAHEILLWPPHSVMSCLVAIMKPPRTATTGSHLEQQLRVATSNSNYGQPLRTATTGSHLEQQLRRYFAFGIFHLHSWTLHVGHLPRHDDEPRDSQVQDVVPTYGIFHLHSWTLHGGHLPRHDDEPRETRKCRMSCQHTAYFTFTPGLCMAATCRDTTMNRETRKCRMSCQHTAYFTFTPGLCMAATCRDTTMNQETRKCRMSCQHTAYFTFTPGLCMSATCRDTTMNRETRKCRMSCQHTAYFTFTPVLCMSATCRDTTMNRETRKCRISRRFEYRDERHLSGARAAAGLGKVRRGKNNGSFSKACLRCCQLPDDSTKQVCLTGNLYKAGVQAAMRASMEDSYYMKAFDALRGCAACGRILNTYEFQPRERIIDIETSFLVSSSNPFKEKPSGAGYALKLQCDWPSVKVGMEAATGNRTGPVTKHGVNSVRPLAA
ncbi:hypothetical protein PR048_016825 [Dryococelus australis]|uniref:Uncharacterized protein n=1 Tax=Dryococelus australis TaxID=614101 RepID=A0ABQ9H7Z4_9NEOP|nr:hypothetical protein PR048_016825 [Dryococelus australis]